jgi:hypothetical protein
LPNPRCLLHANEHAGVRHVEAHRGVQRYLEELRSGERVAERLVALLRRDAEQR